MAELLLINPRHRRRRRKVTRLSANPRRSRRRRRRGGVRRAMTALQRRYFGKRRRSSRRRSRRTAVTRVKRNPMRFARARRYVSHRRRRSRGGSMPTTLGGIMNMIVPASIGAAGALALDMAWASLPLPASLTTGTLAPVTRIAGAVAIGVVVGMVAGRRNGALAGAGALTVTMYDLIKPYVAQALPSVPGLGYYSPARQFGLGTYVGAYVGR